MPEIRNWQDKQDLRIYLLKVSQDIKEKNMVNMLTCSRNIWIDVFFLLYCFPVDVRQLQWNWGMNSQISVSV